jgi:hypothetical protein
MNAFWQILANVTLYSLLLALFYHYAFTDPDPWLAVLVAFVVLVALVVQFLPGLHAHGVSPGKYPFDE